MIHKQFIYRRKRSRWLSLYKNVDDKIRHPIIFGDSYLTRKFNMNIDYAGDDFIQNAEMVIQIKNKNCCLKMFLKLFAMLTIFWTVFIVYNECVLTEKTGDFNAIR